MATLTGQNRFTFASDETCDGVCWLFCVLSRSPWSNEYDPELPDGAVPSPTLRKLEVAANEAFDTYRDLYYGGGVSSVYTFDIDDKFAVVVLIKKGILVATAIHD
jgi:hypothetical protein